VDDGLKGTIPRLILGMPASGSNISGLPQLCVLLLGQTQKQSAPAHGDALLQHQPGFLVNESPAAFNQFDHLCGGCKVQSLGQWSLEVGLQELDLPTLAILERHVYAVATVLAGHRLIIANKRRTLFASEPG